MQLLGILVHAQAQAEYIRLIFDRPLDAFHYPVHGGFIFLIQYFSRKQFDIGVHTLGPFIPAVQQVSHGYLPCLPRINGLFVIIVFLVVGLTVICIGSKIILLIPAAAVFVKGRIGIGGQYFGDSCSVTAAIFKETAHLILPLDKIPPLYNLSSTAPI